MFFFIYSFSTIPTTNHRIHRHDWHLQVCLQYLQHYEAHSYVGRKVRGNCRNLAKKQVDLRIRRGFLLKELWHHMEPSRFSGLCRLYFSLREELADPQCSQWLWWSWNLLPETVVSVESVNSFKNRLDAHWANHHLLYNPDGYNWLLPIIN